MAANLKNRIAPGWKQILVRTFGVGQSTILLKKMLSNHSLLQNSPQISARVSICSFLLFNADETMKWSFIKTLVNLYKLKIKGWWSYKTKTLDFTAIRGHKKIPGVWWKEWMESGAGLAAVWTGMCRNTRIALDRLFCFNAAMAEV